MISHEANPFRNYLTGNAGEMLLLSVEFGVRE